jgi:hypothetical protein
VTRHQHINRKLRKYKSREDQKLPRIFGTSACLLEQTNIRLVFPSMVRLTQTIFTHLFFHIDEQLIVRFYLFSCLVRTKGSERGLLLNDYCSIKHKAHAPLREMNKQNLFSTSRSITETETGELQ